MQVPFYHPYTSEKSAENVQFLVKHPAEISKKSFTRQCQFFFEDAYPGYMALMVGSCTRALELIARALNLGPGDEVIMPSFNYVGVANAFAQTGAELVFADIDPETLNVSVKTIEACLSARTKVVVVMNYAGYARDLETISKFCESKEIVFVEDNAQGIEAFSGNRRLGSFGDFSCISFDSLKNISCGEGGVVLFKPQFQERVETIFNNGTNRMAFEKGEVDSYEWVALGSKFNFSEFNAAILFPLLTQAVSIIQERRERWDTLYDRLSEDPTVASFLPKQMRHARHNGHIFYLKFSSEEERNDVMNFLQKQGITCSFHYTPLHTSVMGIYKQYSMPVDTFTSLRSSCLLRLPVFNALSDEQINQITQHISEVVSIIYSKKIKRA